MNIGHRRSSTGLNSEYSYFPLEMAGAPLESLLPDDSEIVVNHDSGQVVLVRWGYREFSTECSFTDQELPLILALLEAWPGYVPYEKMLGLVGEKPELIAELLEASRAAEGLDEERGTDILWESAMGRTLTPVRDWLKQCQDRLHQFALEIAAVRHRGYLLIPYRPSIPET